MIPRPAQGWRDSFEAMSTLEEAEPMDYVSVPLLASTLRPFYRTSA